MKLRGWLAAGAVLALTGCAEMVRWPDRMNPPRSGASVRSPEPAAEGHYVVKPGDTLYSIAFRNQLDFRELAVWNDVGPDYLIRPGQVVRLTAPAVYEGGEAGPESSGESMPPGPQPVLQSRAPVATPTSPAAPVVTLPGPAPKPMPIPARERPPQPQDMPPIAQWQWPLRGKVIKPFSDGSKGIDVAGEVGQPVLAAGSGKVVYSGAALKGYGELIIIKHDELHLSAYGYNRKRLVGEGATVAAGQPIAELGVGPEQKAALHFEIRRKGKPVDPTEYLPGR
ncbi:MAG TPA: peptidoglycan DD-metalloendopeptidase family protein [Verrucomicrobiae bacterium]|nr:peptidoglycan DD-metalloendopeptidase family protein [Verrucomicrobiae bacterium]